MPDWLTELVTAIAASVLAITLHEAAHGYAALALGDPTAKEAGRLSLNPLRHVDPLGTLIVPGVLLLTQLLTIGRVEVMFGWAKPVPVNILRLRNPRFGMVAVAAAGPAVNIALALAAAFLLHPVQAGLLPDAVAVVLFRFLLLLILANLVLGLFNLIPLPPMDGGRILGGLLPPSIGIPFLRLDRFGLLFVVLILFLAPQIVPGWSPMQWLLDYAVTPAIRLVLLAAGHPVQ
ncbi:site-2 protease family protein [Roseomonas sp. OT10]|uniref:site-2 protease family protein n=1 Tax=Roseomonas cutis TaxID=2897332 RepID=UPI001E4BB7CD|nr:site-2 protease family protein [Roseomonas sp. OT10]UFN50734.1 site-2 protease family protein [Roseomonas sp. OT10]